MCYFDEMSTLKIRCLMLLSNGCQRKGGTASNGGLSWGVRAFFVSVRIARAPRIGTWLNF